ncbi:MAG: M81 family metallopeptidase, partial [Planctomycetales bacterium]|nr:M81 family metallopeptidase [Planctomycetales bacterium]
MRVGVVGLLQESNTFLGQPTTIQHFEEDTLLIGEAVRRRMEDAHHEMGGFFAGLAEAGVEAAPIFFARAIPFGTMTRDAYAQLKATMQSAFAAAGPLDGLLAACHGATVADGTPDVDGDWLGALRSQLGPGRPLIGTLDPHANLSPAMAVATDALVAYQTNPHIDQRERGQEAARLMIRTLRGEIRPTQAAAFLPLAINIERQDTSAPPWPALLADAQAQRERSGLLSNSFLFGFPYADVAEMGCATIAVADGDQKLAQACADELAEKVWQNRAATTPELSDAAAALEQARRLPGPIGLLDMGDNVGGG